MAETFLIIREHRFGIDVSSVEGKAKSREIQALLQINYKDVTEPAATLSDPTRKTDATGIGETDPAGLAEAAISSDQPPADQVEAGEKVPSCFDAALDLLLQKIDVQAYSGVILMLPAPHFYFRNTAFPFTSRSKIRQVLPLELNTGFPVELGAVATDFLQYDYTCPAGSHWVFSASIREEVLGTYYSALVQAGLKPLAITPGPAAMAACFIKKNKQLKNFVFIDVDGDETNGLDISLVLVAHGVVMAIRTMPNDCLPDAVAATVKQELLGFWQRNGQAPTFDIYVTGHITDESFADLKNSLDEVVGFQRAVGERAPRLDHPGTEEPVLDFLPSSQLLKNMEPGLGRLLNLCQGKYASDSFIRTYAAYIMASCVLALTAFILFMVNIHMDLGRLENQVAQREQVIETIFSRCFPEKKIGKIDPLLVMEASVREAARSQGGAGDALAGVQGSVQAGKVLLELSNRISGSVDIVVDRLMLDKERMILSGSADNFNAIDQVKGLLEASPLFKKVEIGSAVAGKKANRVDFKFVIEI